MILERGWFIPTLQIGPEDVFLVEDWEESPAGPYRAVFHFTPEDFRTLYVDSEGGGEVASSFHRCDRVLVTAITSLRDGSLWTLEWRGAEGEDVRVEVAYRADATLRAINRVAPHVPDAIARNRAYCRLLPHLAAPIMGTDPRQKIAGVTELGRRVRFRLDEVYRVVDAGCRWGERDLGALSECRYRHDMGDFRPVSRAMVIYLALYME